MVFNLPLAFAHHLSAPFCLWGAALEGQYRQGNKTITADVSGIVCVMAIICYFPQLSLMLPGLFSPDTQ